MCIHSHLDVTAENKWLTWNYWCYVSQSPLSMHLCLNRRSCVKMQNVFPHVECGSVFVSVGCFLTVRCRTASPNRPLVVAAQWGRRHEGVKPPILFVFWSEWEQTTHTLWELPGLAAKTRNWCICQHGTGGLFLKNIPWWQSFSAQVKNVRLVESQWADGRTSTWISSNYDND